jgi:hypothetical protein
VPLIVFLVLWPSALAAAPSIGFNVATGFDGYFIPGSWTPLRIDLVLPSSFEGVLAIDVTSAQALVRTFRFPVRFVGGARHQLHADVVIPDPRYPLMLRLLSGTHEIARYSVSLGAARAVDGVVVVLAAEAVGLEFLTNAPGRLRPAYLVEEGLPIRWQSYEGVRAVVIRDLQDMRLQDLQREALREWVAQGGRLVVMGPELLHSARPPWLMDLLPAVPRNELVTEAVTLVPDHPGPVTLALMSPRPGASAWPDRGPPQRLEWRYGRGTVTVWTFDALASTIRTSPTLVQQWQHVLTGLAPSVIATRTLADVVPTTPALPGLAQLALALSVIAYIAALRWVLPRAALHRGWMLLGAVVVGAGGLMYGVAAVARSSVAAIAQVSLVETIPDVRLARVTTYAGVTAPFGGTFQLVAPLQATIRPVTGASVNLTDGPPSIEDPIPLRRGRFEILQVIPLAVRGTVARSPQGFQVAIENPDELPVRDPILYLDGQIYRLPVLRTRTVAMFDLTQGEPIERYQVGRDTLADRLRQWTFVGPGSDAIIKRGQPALIGWVEDARLMVRSPQTQRSTAASLLVVPLASP